MTQWMRLLIYPSVIAITGGAVVKAAPLPPSMQASSTGARLEFEVASVRSVQPPAPPHGVGLTITPGRVEIEAATLRQILGLAYGIQRVRIIGGPGWTDFEEYTIAAKPERADASRDQIRTMLQTLLAERFKVSLHRETREITVYKLIQANGGTTLKTAKAGGTLEVVPEQSRLTFSNAPLAGLVNYLANILDSPVQDETGLSGSYDFRLEVLAPTGEKLSPFTMVQEQLGLKLEATKAPVEVLVIDHAERATPN
jgi:uncharacterized protein (TIGR03435 family)